MKKAIIHALLAVFVSLCGVACKDSRKKTESECVQDMQKLALCARSYALEKSLKETDLVNPHELLSYMKSEPTCSLGSLSYKPFTLREGPSCPNSKAHTAAFQKSWKQIKQSFSNIVYSVSCNAGVNGHIRPENVPPDMNGSWGQTVTNGTSVAFIATPDARYVVDQWFTNGNLVQVGRTKFRITNVSTDIDVIVTFKPAVSE